RRYLLPPERAACAARPPSRKSPDLFLCPQCPLRVALDYTSLFEGLSEPPAVGHLGERLAPLLALACGLSRIAEWDNRQQIQICRYTQERLDLVQNQEAYRVRANRFLPSRQNPRFKLPAPLRDNE